MLAKMCAQRAGGAVSSGAGNDTSAPPGALPSTSAPPGASPILEEWTPPLITSHNVVSVDVCGGVDCHGHGGAACLIELEELAKEHPALPGGERFVVQRSPCMRLCGKGPNVRLQVTDETDPGVSRTLGVEHVTEVRSPHDCVRVLAVATRTAAEATATATGGAAIQIGVSKTPTPQTLPAAPVDHRVAIMSRRAENMRWEALKVVSRRGEEERGALLLQEAYRADANASKPGGEALVRRAARRATRLTALAARPAKDPLPSTLAGGKGGRGRREKSETQDAPAPP
jgi:hypothetical protein